MSKTRLISILGGAIITGLGIGLFAGQPGFGLVTGLGFGLLFVGIISSK